MAVDTSKPRLVVLISGSGRNLQAMIDAIGHQTLDAELVRVISNRGDAYGLKRAERAGAATAVLRANRFQSREAYDVALGELVAEAEPDMVAMAGFMRILSSGFVQRFAGRVVNIHPSLLPRYRGLDTHRRVLEAGDARHGASIHFVTDELDAGPVIVQGAIKVVPDDTVETLADRVMRRVETRIYPMALQWLASARAVWRDGEVWFDGQPLEQPIYVDCDKE